MGNILEEEYDSNTVAAIFGYRKKIKIRRSANRKAQKHVNKLAAKSGANPQDNNNVRKKRRSRVQILYGSEPIKNDSSSSYAAAAKINPSNVGKNLKNSDKSKTTREPNDSGEIAELCASIEKLDQH